MCRALALHVVGNAAQQAQLLIVFLKATSMHSKHTSALW
jgi:hypothetical protein